MTPKPSRDIKSLIDIMARLRDPEAGCAWDIEQTFETIAPYTIEEAYEVSDAIDRKDYDDLKEELGDLLLQPVYHARIAEELGHFNFDDVVESVTGKLIRRHPHVFGPEQQRSLEMARGQWTKIKLEEKEERASRRAAAGLPDDRQPGIFSGVARNGPATAQALDVQRAVAKVGFDWDSLSPVFDKISEELEEVRDAVSRGSANDQKEEIGDLLFAVINLARHLGIDPDNALRATNRKFMDRFSRVEAALEDRGKSVETAQLDEMEAAWQTVKKSD